MKPTDAGKDLQPFFSGKSAFSEDCLNRDKPKPLIVLNVFSSCYLNKKFCIFLVCFNKSGQLINNPGHSPHPLHPSPMVSATPPLPHLISLNCYCQPLTHTLIRCQLQCILILCILNSILKRNNENSSDSRKQGFKFYLNQKLISSQSSKK